MRRYTRPEMECRAFAAESVLTASDPGTSGSSMDALKSRLGGMADVKDAPIVERNWADMSS